MNIRSFLVLLLAFASVALQPSARADDKKKKKEASKADYDQQWKLEQMQRNQAAQAAAQQAAARRAAGQLGVPLNPGAPQDDKILVHVYNHTRGAVQLVEESADGRTVTDLGTILPSGPPDNNSTGHFAKPGTKLAVVANGQLLTRYTTSTEFQQEMHVRAAAAPPRQPTAIAPMQPAAPAGDGYVQVQVTNRTGVPLDCIRYLPDGSAKSFGIIQPNALSTLRTKPGMVWTFNSGDTVVEGYLVEQAVVQQLVIGM